LSLLLDTSGVLVLVDHLARNRLGENVVRGFLEGLARGEGLYLPFLAEDLPQALEVMDAYPGVGFVDASIVVLAEKHRVRKVLTLDRRDFTRFRPRGLDYLELLP
jgi:predicted nucleic acid-binding protein